MKIGDKHLDAAAFMVEYTALNQKYNKVLRDIELSNKKEFEKYRLSVVAKTQFEAKVRQLREKYNYWD